MKLSTKCRYGARAIIEIGKNYNKIPTKRKDITCNQGIPSSYLENILIGLKSSGLVATIRGPKGGFTLGKKPEEITMLDVVEALNGSLAPVDCITQDFCQNSSSCVTKEVWEKLQKAQEEVLRSYTVADLVAKSNAMTGLDFSI
jgi:Rrf2 family protein